MDHQDHKRNNSSGHEGHGVYLCHKCGWPFPNPHPSAKHRRAHKKVCGTIEGYKLVDSQDNPLSDDDHSDEDHTTPSPKVVERAISKRGSGGIGSRSNRSEDDVFSDAVAEFQDSGYSPGIEGHSEEAGDPVTNIEKITKNDRNSTEPFMDSAIVDGIQPPGNSTDINQLQNPEVPKSMTNLLGSTQESQDHESSFTEEAVVMHSDRSGSSQDLYLIKPKTPAEIQEKKKINADDDVTEKSITYIRQETHAKGNEEINLDGNVPDVVVPASENASETSEAVSKSDYAQKITSDPIPAEGVVHTQESQDLESSFTEEADVMPSDDRSGSSQDLYLIKPETPADTQENKKTNADDDVTERSIIYTGQETHAKGNEEINLDGNVSDVVVPTSENASETSEAVSKSEYTQKITSDPMPAEGVVQMKEEYSSRLASMISSGDLSATVESVEHMNDSVDTVQFKMDAAQGIDFACSVKSIEGNKRTEEGNENVHVLSVPGDIPVVDNAEMKLEDFKDHKGLKSHQSVTLDSCKTIKYKEDDLEDPVSEKNFSSFQSRHLSEGTEVYASDMHVVKDNLNHEGENSKPKDKELPIEGEPAMPKIKFTNNEGLNDLEAPTDSLKQGGNNKPVVKEVPVEGEADVPLIKPTNNEGSNELEAPADNFEHEGQNRKPMVEKMPVEGEADVPEVNLTNNAGSNELEAPADNLEHEGGKRKPMIEKLPVEGEADVLEIKLANNARSNELDAPADKFEDEGGNCKLKEVPVEGVDDMPQIKLTNNEGSDELGAHTDNVTVKMEESCTVCSPEEPQPHDICNNSSQMSSRGTATDVLFDVNLMVAPVEAEVNQTTNLVVMDDAGNHEKATTEICDLAGDVEKKSAEEENYTESTITTFESSSGLSESQIIRTTNLLEVDNAGDYGKVKIENSDVGIDSREGPVEENLLMKTETTARSAGGLHDSQIVSEGVMDASAGKSPEIEYAHVDGVSDTQGGVKKLEINDNDEVQGERVSEVSLATESYHGGDVELLLKTSEDHLTKEQLLPPLNTESSIQSSAAVENNHAREFGGNASGISSQSLQGEDNNGFVKHQLGASVMDVAVDSCSQTDSLEGNWGSVSVLSTQSDTLAVIDAEEQTNLQRPKVPSDGQHSDKSESFDPPSFMTLVQPGGGSDQKGAEIQMVQSSQQPNAASLQSGWFPSITHVANESQGRKKNEEIIAKVTNWSTGKQHTPLKSLLGEASLEAKPKSPNPKENQGPVVQKDETTAKDNGAVATKVTSVLGPEAPIAEPAKREMGKEWNSPARYPADIKREKRKVKGKPFWVQFACCSSVN